MGSIDAFQKAGFPLSLLLPVIPWDGTKDQRAGKSPGTLGTDGTWVGLRDWENGVDPAILLALDRRGANCGILLGKETPDGSTLVVMDIDTEPHPTDPAHRDSRIAQILADIAVSHASSEIKGPFWVRLSRPGRASILFRMAKGAAPGSKEVLSFYQNVSGNSVKRGKIEILARGQQCAVGGSHVFGSGTPLRWYRTDNPSEMRPAPAFASLPVIRDRECLSRIVEAFKKDIEGRGLLTTRRAGKPSEALDYLTSDEKLPPSPDRLVNTLDGMPHDDRVTRADYVNIMRSVAACTQAMAQRNMPFDDITVSEAAVSWAARWPGTSFEDEESKWESDFRHTVSDYLGWPVINHWALRLGEKQAITERAQDDFEASAEAPPAVIARAELAGPLAKNDKAPLARADIMTGKGEGVRKIRKRKLGDVNLCDVPSSDIQIADSIQEDLEYFALWIAAEKRWIIWNGTEYGWAHPEGSLVVERWIQDELVAYTMRHGSGWNDSARARVMSQAKVSAVERILRSRLCARADEVNSKPLYLQTPDGAYDLRTGEKISWRAQRDLIDTRRTSVTPRDGASPHFDQLIRHLCCGDAAVTNWLWHYLGYLLLGKPAAHILLVLYGPGGNGKGAFDRALQHVLGDYGVTLDKGVVLESGRADHKTALYEIRGRRYWGVSEIRAGEAWNEGQVQSLTGGDIIKARGMGQDMQSVKAEGAFVISTNHLPKFHQINNAIARRFRFIHSRLVPDKPDYLLSEKLAAEAPAILAKMMGYARKVLGADFALPETPAAMEAVANLIFAEQDTFFTWFRENLVRRTGASVTLDEARKSFAAYLPGGVESEGPDMGTAAEMTRADFIASMRRAGFLCVKGRVNGRITDTFEGVDWCRKRSA